MRLLIVSDSPDAATGFGTASAHLLPRLARAGFDIDLLAIYAYGSGIRVTDWGTAFPVDRSDSMGFLRLASVIERGPAAVVLMHELVYCQEWARRLRAAGWAGPIVGYFPVYGPVFSPMEKAGLRLMDERVTLSTYGAQVVEGLGYRATSIHLGVDTERFKPAPSPLRRRLRREMGWNGKFVVAYVARNRWNKQQPKLMKAARILDDAGDRDFLFYLHCVPTPGPPHWVPGQGAVTQEYDLVSLRRYLGLEGIVCFPDELTDQNEGIPQDRLIQRLQAADCVAHVAHGEGFGLPLVEAMACGLPVVHTADGRVMSEIVARAGIGVRATQELADGVGNRFGDVTPAQWAEAIRSLRDRLRVPSRRWALRRRARRRSQRFSWDDAARALGHAVRGAAARGHSWRRG